MLRGTLKWLQLKFHTMFSILHVNLGLHTFLKGKQNYWQIFEAQNSC